jgi:hypothetical protein
MGELMDETTGNITKNSISPQLAKHLEVQTNQTAHSNGSSQWIVSISGGLTSVVRRTI